MAKEFVELVKVVSKEMFKVFDFGKEMKSAEIAVACALSEGDLEQAKIRGKAVLGCLEMHMKKVVDEIDELKKLSEKDCSRLDKFVKFLKDCSESDMAGFDEEMCDVILSAHEVNMDKLEKVLKFYKDVVL